MFKMKTNRGAAKRFKVTKSGRIKHAKAYKSHILTKKTTKRKRQLRESTYISNRDQKRVKRLIPYK